MHHVSIAYRIAIGISSFQQLLAGACIVKSAITINILIHVNAFNDLIGSRHTDVVSRYELRIVSYIFIRLYATSVFVTEIRVDGVTLDVKCTGGNIISA